MNGNRRQPKIAVLKGDFGVSDLERKTVSSKNLRSENV